MDLVYSLHYNAITPLRGASIAAIIGPFPAGGQREAMPRPSGRGATGFPLSTPTAIMNP